MAHIENIFICITVPLLISLFFIKGKQRSFTMFICIGMSICMASAYVNSFFMTMYGADAVSTAIQIAPVCEEIMKLLPLLFFILIFEPRPGEIIPAAIAIILTRKRFLVKTFSYENVYFCFLIISFTTTSFQLVQCKKCIVHFCLFRQISKF